VFPRDPFSRIPTSRLGRWALILTGVAILPAAVILAFLEAGPGFDELTELVTAGNTDSAREAMIGWSDDDRLRVAFVAGFDGVFGFAWTTALALACFWMARQMHARRWQLAGIALGWLAWVALAFDIPENGAYLAMTMGNTGDPWPQMAIAALTVRCVVLAAALAYLAAALAVGRRASADPVGQS
jgi:hypothetical protein